MDNKCKQQEAKKAAHASSWPGTAAATGVATEKGTQTGLRGGGAVGGGC